MRRSRSTSWPAARSGVAVVVLSALVLCGCGGPSAPADPTRSPSPSVRLGATGRPLPVRPDCAARDGGRFVLTRTTFRAEVGVLVLGSGPAGVVLSPQSDGDICQWLPVARELARRYRVALFDWQEPRREVPLLAVRVLRDLGVRRVVLGGASMGGAYALADAHRARPALAGVVSFSGETTLRGGFVALPGLARWSGSLLVVGSVHDPFFGRADARRVARAHPGRETMVLVPGHGHGVDLFAGPSGARVRAALDRFLARVLSRG